MVITKRIVLKKGIEVFGKGKFRIWLSSRNKALGGKTPKKIMQGYDGFNIVFTELVRIEHGLLA
jgi:uncharacterized protein (DUF2384 family)